MTLVSCLPFFLWRKSTDAANAVRYLNAQLCQLLFVLQIVTWRVRTYHVIKELSALLKGKKSWESCFIGALTRLLVCTAFRTRNLGGFILSWQLQSHKWAMSEEVTSQLTVTFFISVQVKSTYSLNYATKIYCMHYAFFTVFSLLWRRKSVAVCF